MRLLLIGNPVSGRGKTPAEVQRIVHAARNRGHEIHVEFTSSTGSAYQLAQNMAPGFDCLMVAGGDGTINDVINGASPELLPPIATIRTGTANILARELSVPRSPQALLAAIERGKVLEIRVAQANNRRFLMLVSCGFDALVTKQIRMHRPKYLGFRGYFRPILKALKEYSPPAIIVRLDSQTEVQAQLVVVQRITKYGGIFEFSKNASLMSDTFEVCAFSRASFTDIIKYGLMGLLRLARFSHGIKFFRASTITINAQPQSPVEVDGDYFSETPVDIRLTDSTVRLVVP